MIIAQTPRAVSCHESLRIPPRQTIARTADRRDTPLPTRPSLRTFLRAALARSTLLRDRRGLYTATLTL